MTDVLNTRVSKSVALHLALSVGVALALVPLSSALAVALIPRSAPVTGAIQLVPTSFAWANFVEAWKSVGLGSLMRNSLIVSGTITVVQVFISTLAAYAISRARVPGHRILLWFFVVTIFLSDQVLLLPDYLLLQRFRLLDSLLGVILPKLAWGLSIIVLVRYMETIPRELDDAAQIDGANHWRTFWNVIVPLSRPAIGTMAIYTFVGTWNDFVLPLVVLSSSSKYTLPLGLLELGGPNVAVAPQIKMAALLIGLAPMIIAFLVLYRYFMRGNVAGSVKG